MSHLPGMKSYLAIPTAIARTAFLLLLCAPASWADTEGERESLSGLPGVGVVVEKLVSDVERDSLTRGQIQTDVELRLRQARITVLTGEEILRTPESAFLYVRVGTVKDPAYSIYAFTRSTSHSGSKSSW